MRRIPLLLTVSALLALIPQGFGQDKKYPAPGSKLPGAFHPYNVTGLYGEKPNPKEAGKELKGQYHCPVSDANLDPGVLVFIKGIEAGDEVKDLLLKLENAVEKNPAVRLHVTAVFYDELLPEVVGANDKNDDKREEYATKLRKLANELKLKHVVLTIAGRDDLKTYIVDDGADVTLVAFRRFNTEFVQSMTKKVVNEKLKQILSDLGTKLGAKRE